MIAIDRFQAAEIFGHEQFNNTLKGQSLAVLTTPLYDNTSDSPALEAIVSDARQEVMFNEEQW